MPLPVGHIGLTVPDVDAAASWYGELFGWTVILGPLDVSVDDDRVADQLRDVFEADRVTFRQVHMLAADGVAIELFEFHEPRTEGMGQYDYWNVGFSHVCVVEPAIDALASTIEQSGGKRRTEIRQVFPNEPYRFCYCEDPYGNVIEITTHRHAEIFGGRSGY
jgi:catechol 2,3-dioxygenase-like lactoylglutathione lyase family enzyme